MALAAITTLAVAVPLAGVTGERAFAAPTPGPDGSGTGVPTQQQVTKAKRSVAAKKLSVEQIEAQLAGAQAQVETAAQVAESAFEKYNGARYELQQAKLEAAKAKTAAVEAAGDVESQRGGIVQLVTESYQNGTELNAATALMSDEGPQGLMNRYGVVQSAGDSMQAAYDRFKVASAKAKKYAGQAADAADEQKSLATSAKQLATEAGEAAAQAGMVANQIASQKATLVEALAKAENISVDLAKERTDALEQIAARKKAEAQQAQEAAMQEALHQQALEAAAKAKQAKKSQPKTSTEDDTDGAVASVPVTSAPAPVANAAPNQSAAVQLAIAYAKAQIGKPYQWAAAGPSRFDCSGLTMQAWARGGKALPHYSVAQFDQSTRVSMVDAQPGDLLFWSNNGSPSGIHHVALYVGGGQFIEAPRTGLNVRYNSIYTWYPDFVARP